MVVLFGAIALQLFLSVGRPDDPYHRFGFRPFPAADTWSAEIVRVDRAGERRPVDDGSWEYDWDTLVGAPPVVRPFRERFASRGAAATVDLLQRALDWAAANTPADTDTAYLEATVDVFHNQRRRETIVLRSAEREAAL
jgi:hypothetical protein